MSYVCNIYHYNMTYHKHTNFDSDLQDIATLAKILSHPARLAILKHLSQCNECISGDISEEIPLSRTTVSQHLQELKKSGLIQGSVSGTKVNYCLNPDTVIQHITLLNNFLSKLNTTNYCKK
jgi:ArsR family transcriptional regulator, arsenate/arsenite/antimonite-responsive transcriptional repressor